MFEYNSSVSGVSGLRGVQLLTCEATDNFCFFWSADQCVQQARHHRVSILSDSNIFPRMTKAYPSLLHHPEKNVSLPSLSLNQCKSTQTIWIISNMCEHVWHGFIRAACVKGRICTISWPDSRDTGQSAYAKTVQHWKQGETPTLALFKRTTSAHQHL